MTARRGLAALGFALLPFAAVAAEEDAVRWYLQVDNDVVFVTDRWYSSGVRVGRVARHGSDEVEFGFLHEVYMPEQRNWEPGRADRRPTARALFVAAHHRRDEQSFQTIEADLGWRGPAALGRQTTEFVHRAIPSQDVDWTRQLPARLDGAFIFARSQWLSPLRLHYGAVLGDTLTFAHVGAEVRYGPGSRDIDFQVMRFAATPPFPKTRDGLGWSVFGGLSGRAIARNALIGPNYDPGAAEIRLRRTVARFAGGAAWTFPSGSVTFAIVRDGREFTEQRKPQCFGSLGLDWSF